MGRTFIRQDAQIRNSILYDDTVAPSSAMETGTTTIEDDLNNLRSQVELMLDAAKAGNWYDDIATVTTLGAAKKRSILQLNTDLDELEEQRILCGAQVLTDVSVPAAVAATGTITTVAKANLIDGETVTIDDGINAPTVFEFDVAGDGVGGGNVQVNVSALTTADEVRDALISAITGVGATLEVSAVSGGAATVNLTHDRSGTVGNNTVTETVADTGFAVSGLSGGAGDVVVLNQAGGETPTDTAAVTPNTALGAVVAVLSGDVGQHDLAEQTGANALSPYNLVLIRDATTKDTINTAGGEQIFGLLQAETGTVDGDSFNDSTKQVQISFVINDGADDLAHVDGTEIGGQTIEYLYPKRVSLDTLPQHCAFPPTFQDRTALVDVTLDRAIDNQVGPASQTDRNIDWRITDNFTLDFQTSDGGRTLLSLAPTAGGDSLTVDVDTLDINNALDADFLNGATFDSGGTAINVGVSAGTIDAAGLTLESTGAGNDLRLTSGRELFLDDVNQTGSTWAQTNGIKLSETTQEWDDFETAFGEVSLLNAILQAYNAAASGVRQSKTYAVLTSNVAADTDVGGPATSNNLDVDLDDYSGVTFLTDMDLFLNGVLLRPGADAAANNDYYPGTNGTTQLKFEFALKANPGNPDVLCQILYS